MQIRNYIYSLLCRFLKKRNHNHRLSIQKKDIEPIFIIGCGRSGNTFLAKCLHETGDIFFPPENFSLLRCYSYYLKNINKSWVFRVRGVIKILESQEMSNRWKLCDSQIIIRDLLNTDEKTLGNIIHTWYSMYGKTIGYPSARWGCKTPNITPFINDMLEIFPKAKIIYIYRDPSEVVQSFALTSLKIYNKPSNAEAIWFYYNKVTLQNTKKSNFIWINFEDLIDKRSSTIKKIVNHLKLNPNKNKVEFINEDLKLAHLLDLNNDYHQKKYYKKIHLHYFTRRLYKSILSKNK